MVALCASQADGNAIAGPGPGHVALQPRHGPIVALQSQRFQMAKGGFVIAGLQRRPTLFKILSGNDMGCGKAKSRSK